MKTYICSYCKVEGHYINKCNHPSINILHDKIKKDAVIQMYCMIKYNFNFLLYIFDLLTSPEIRILLYKNCYNQKISSYPTKIDLQNYYQFLNQTYSFINKDFINIPYIDNTLLWDYATVIHKNIDLSSILSVYTDIVKISPRPYCYNIDINFTDNPIIRYNNDNYRCAICLENILKESICTMNCNHSFCINCIKLYLISLYKNINDNNEFFPNCPLCRTYISNILINDNFAYVYFQETFFTKFIPNFFNSINENEITHNYEKPFYHETIDFEEVYDDDDDDIILSPYNHPVNMHHCCLLNNIGKMIGKTFTSISFFFTNRIILYNLITLIFYMKLWVLFLFFINTLLT